jgi:hypothetical protein
MSRELQNIQSPLLLNISQFLTHPNVLIMNTNIRAACFQQLIQCIEDRYVSGVASRLLFEAPCLSLRPKSTLFHRVFCLTLAVVFVRYRCQDRGSPIPAFSCNMRGIASQRPEAQEVDDSLWNYYGATNETKQRSINETSF